MPTREISSVATLCNGSLPAHITAAIDAAARAAAEAVRSQCVAAALIAAQNWTPTAAQAPERQRQTRAQYATREGVSEATVSRWIKEGMPVMPVGSTVRIDPIAADDWRRARGRKPTKATSATPNVDVDADLARAGLRVVGGGGAR